MLVSPVAWSEISSRAMPSDCYTCPRLRQTSVYAEFVRMLHSRSLVSFHRVPRGRVGVFGVAKKSGKVRLVLDCRRVNGLFRAPPYTSLGSVASLTEFSLERGSTLYYAGTDIENCFYECGIPEGLAEYFGLPYNVLVGDLRQMGLNPGEAFLDHEYICPCFRVLPMGFSWSFWFVQELHTQVVERVAGIPREQVVRNFHPYPFIERDEAHFMPYCDNLNVFAGNADVCGKGRDAVKAELLRLGFTTHEDVGPTTLCSVLGFLVDGDEGSILLGHEKRWLLFLAFRHLGETGSASPKCIQRLLGHLTVLLSVCRNGMSCVRHLHDFSGESNDEVTLWPSAAIECKMIAGLIPMLTHNMRREWSASITCTDASFGGFGVCQRDLDVASVKDMGRWSDRWRYKRLTSDSWNFRARVIPDPLTDLASVGKGGFEEEDSFRLEQSVGFPEVPKSVCDPEDWKVVMRGSWNYSESSITVLEGRCLVLSVRRLLRNASNHGLKHLALVDNLGLSLAVAKGRACAFDLLRVCQQLITLCVWLEMSLSGLAGSLVNGT
eukprot:6477718-Amphidinium_carterae.1